MRDVAGSSGKAELYFSIAALLGSVACTGVMDGGTLNGESGTPGGPGGPGAPGGGQQVVPTNPGRGEMHRLNSTEYNATVADVLGTTLQPAASSWRGGEVDGFDNIGSVLGVDDTQYELYVDAAEALATDVFANPALKAKYVTCATQDDMACVQQVISKAGLKIFRRPLRQAELATYQKVYTATRAQGQDHDGALKHVLWSLLSSAEFLYRIELPQGSTKRPLDGFELASRLSYFLWSSAPDDALLETAAKGALETDAEVKAALARMLSDTKSRRFVESFAGQWLGARKLTAHAVASERFPIWNEQVATAAQQEMYAYFDEFLRRDRPWSEFLKADLNFVNAALAPLYGIPNVTGMQLLPVQNTTDKRAGFLGLAGFLTLTSMDRRTSPTLRGRWVLGNLLCQEPPPPPANVPKLEVGGKDLDNGNIRQILTEHRVRPDCAGCHGLFDPFGLALEQFDAVGRYREKYGDGSSIDASASLGTTAFTGLSGAADVVTATPDFNACVAHKMFVFGLGRTTSGDDKGWIEQIEGKWESGELTLRRLMEQLVLSVPFRNSGDVK
jgi:hypothetical protein